MRRFPLAIVIVLTAVAPGFADDWPQWRGPNHDGNSAEKGWSTDLTKAWEKQVGPGCSSVAVVGDRVYTMGYDKGNDVVLCFNAIDGSEIWSKRYPSDIWAKMHEGGPGSTPCVYKDKVYTLGRDGQLNCYNADTGDQVWSKNLASDFGAQPPQWGITGSAIIVDDQLMLETGVILSLDPEDGSENWKTRNYGVAYSTPAPLSIGRNDMLAAFPKFGLVVVNRKTGSQVAAHGWETKYGVNSTTPIVHRNTIFISSGYGTGCAMLRLQGRKLTAAWQSKEMRNKMATSVLYRNSLYGFDEKVLKCLDPSNGKKRWGKGKLGLGSLMIADGKLIVLSERGELLIANASPQGFSATTRTKAVSGGKTWVVPVLANGRIYCRNNGGHLVCFEASG